MKSHFSICKPDANWFPGHSKGADVLRDRTSRHALPCLFLLASLGFCVAATAAPASDPPGVSKAASLPLAAYQIVWDSPSTDATGSMPLAGGDLGLNVWVEGDDLLFYIAHPDSRVEDEHLVKLGRVRLNFGPGVFRKNFRQELDLQESRIRIQGDGIKLNLWVDAFASVVHVEMDSDAPVEPKVAFESWRFTAAPVKEGIEWVYRHDPAKSPHALKIKRQRAEPIAASIPDPLANLTMGGRIVAPGLVDDGTGEGIYMKTPFKAWKARTEKPTKRLDLRVLLRVAQDASNEVWRAEIDRLQKSATDRDKTLSFWRGFWNRSHIVINPAATPDDPAWQAGRNYQLFRYMLAANRTGKAPTLFNGGLFTFDNPLKGANAFGAGGPNPDCRAWWGCHFMGQNQRLVYWPMLKTGDSDLLDVGLNFYRDREPVARAKAKHFLGVEGTLFTESLDIFGLVAARNTTNGIEAYPHLAYHFTTGIEFAYMMMESCRFSGRDPASSLPVAMGMLRFYDNLYQKECIKRTGKPLDEKGRLVIHPGNAVEQGVGCKNHTDAIAGLHSLTEALLALPGTDRAWLEGFRKRLPAIPLTEKDGRRVIALAESFDRIANSNEFPQMYAVFPFRRYAVDLPDLDLARDTWRFGATEPANQKECQCWKYDNIVVATLGMTAEAKDYALRKLLYPFGKDGGKGKEGPTLHFGNCAGFVPRFPAFWSTYPFDHFPDMDHGGCAMTGLQEMLMQTPGKRILLFPAWPREWNVSFKLHAPAETTVEGELKDGKLISLKVTPESRRKDVENLLVGADQ